jgi:hypothetical protein
MKRLTAAILVLLFTMMSGCGYKEGVQSEERVAYLYFSGSAKGAVVYIDDLPTFTVEKLGPDEPYKVAPGKHMIILKKEGQILVQRTLMLGDGIAKEIYVP